MLTIGEFSRICMVTAKTLRYYDAIGLVKPVAMGQENGYRYYEEGQLARMLEIQRLKAYGFSLEEIQALLDGGRAALLQALRSRAAEQTQELEARAALLARIQRDIANLEKGMELMREGTIDVQIKEMEDRQVLSMRERIPIAAFDGLYGRLMELASQEGVEIHGYPIAVYHCEAFDPENTDVELCLETEAKTPHTRVLPGGLAAVGVHFGSYSRLSETYGQIACWIGENGYRIAGAPYEQYRNSPHQVPDSQLVTEIYFPVARA